ncbi:hypothetical protein MBLNU459_g0565t2 [Dothideomycetes sp. NU459]
MPPMQPLQTTIHTDEEISPFEEPKVEERSPDIGPSCDNSPKITPRHESLQNVPIESLYQITRLRSLRAETSGEEPGSVPSRDEGFTSDVVTKGIIPLEDAERLAKLYLDRLDHYAYSIANKFRNLQDIRRSSAALTAAIITVAALHDSNSNHLFGPCCREFKSLLSVSMFDRRVDRQYLRAMCIGSYWLSDISWTLSGHAIRRAMGINLSANYHRVMTDNSEDAADCLRLWYLLYICDQHLSILYGRSTIIRRDELSIQNWDRYLEKRVAVEQDRRMMSQVSLLIIMGNIRAFFGSHTGETLPQSFTDHIITFDRQLDHWFPMWFQQLRTHESIGDFPGKGVLFHFNMAKLHLHSHVFRGLNDTPVPSYFRESAIAAARAATTIVELLLTERDLRGGLVGMPHYLHTMIAFACGFLLQLTTKHDGDLVQKSNILDLIGRLAQQLRVIPAGKWHLVRFLAEGLEKMVEASIRTPTQVPGRLFNPYQMGNEQVTDSTSSAALDFLPRQADFGFGQADAFMMPDFGVANSFLPFEDSAILKPTDFGFL